MRITIIKMSFSFLTCLMLMSLQACSSVPVLEPQNVLLPPVNREFDVNYTGFNKENILLAAGIANSSYEYNLLTTRNRLSKKYDMECVDLLYLNDSYRRVLLASRKNYLFISINGTEAAEDWWNDAKYKVYYTDDSVPNNLFSGLPTGAGGFRRVYSEIRDSLPQAITTSPCYSDSEDQQIFYTGHSLGSALGIISAKHLCSEYKICYSGMFLFAAPLTAVPETFKDTRAYRKEKILVFQNGNDYVVRAGARDKLAHPSAVYVLENGAYTKHEKLKYVKYSLLDKFSLRIAEDHPMDSYINSILSIKPEK